MVLNTVIPDVIANFADFSVLVMDTLSLTSGQSVSKIVKFPFPAKNIVVDVVGSAADGGAYKTELFHMSDVCTGFLMNSNTVSSSTTRFAMSAQNLPPYVKVVITEISGGTISDLHCRLQIFPCNQV